MRVFHIVAAVVLALCACSSPQANGRARTPPAAAEGPAVDLSLESVEPGERVETRTLRGRPLLVVLVATWDVASHAQARFVTGVWRRRGGRVGAIAVALDPPANRPLVRAFRDTLRVEYPFARASPADLAEAFGETSVPSVVLLGPGGGVVWRHAGIVPEADLDAELDRRGW